MIQESENNQPVVLTIAGFDPSGGAGIIADIKTLLHFDCRPVAAVTSITFQNSEAVFGAIHESAESLRAQVLPVIQEAKLSAIKLGMLPTAEIVAEVARLIREHDLPAPVIDPVLRSSSDYELIEASAIEVLKRELIPLAQLITPNVPEAEMLTGMEIEDEQGMREAAQKLCDIGARAVLVKGGHLRQEPGDRGQGSEEKSEPAIDVLNDEGQVTVFSGEWITSPPVRGTGCMLSSAIAACLAQGVSLEESIRLAKDYVAEAIRFARKDGIDSVMREFDAPFFGRGLG
jgi:hydroxymethylpyrimidine/phosphomethylpyrimidine kinase